MENEKKHTPYVIDVEPGTYAFCACGKSTKLPYCDGSHKDTDIKPVIETITEQKTIAICGCGKTQTGTRCDGSHKKD